MLAAHLVHIRGQPAGTNMTSIFEISVVSETDVADNKHQTLLKLLDFAHFFIGSKALGTRSYCALDDRLVFHDLSESEFYNFALGDNKVLFVRDGEYGLTVTVEIIDRYEEFCISVPSRLINPTIWEFEELLIGIQLLLNRSISVMTVGDEMSINIAKRRTEERVTSLDVILDELLKERPRWILWLLAIPYDMVKEQPPDMEVSQRFQKGIVLRPRPGAPLRSYYDQVFQHVDG